LGIVFLFGRSVELQIIKGSYFRDLSEGNRIRRVPIIAPRGKILSRGGEVFVGNVKVEKKIVFDPVGGYTKVDDVTGALDDEKISEWKRDYILADKLAHVTGYLGEVGADEVGKIDPNCIEKGPFYPGDLIGRSGLEQQYNCLLAGIDGEELIEVDTAGKKVRTLGKKEPISGQEIKTTIDLNLQKKVSELMQDKKGAVVVSDTKGEILAFYSSPSFDPNDFVSKKNSKKVQEVLNDANMPMFDRVISGLYHPGSTFKPLVAIASLEEGAIDKDYTYRDTGQIVLNTLYGTYTYGNWYYSQYGAVEGKINLVRALARSTDTFFYTIGELVGVDNLVKWSRIFGLDSKTNIDLPGEVGGLIPTPQWKLEIKNEKWFLGNTYHMAIGQGDVAVTPIALNSYISAIASGGQLCSPRFVKEESCKNLGLNANNVELVKEGMSQACSTGGTGYPFFDSDPKVGCKTGTAETNKKDVTHAWFTFFAPNNNPKVVATVFVEEGGEGSSVAGPIARDIFDYYFSKN
jgi:penicillin-binding protein 2